MNCYQQSPVVARYQVTDVYGYFYSGNYHAPTQTIVAGYTALQASDKYGRLLQYDSNGNSADVGIQCVGETNFAVVSNRKFNSFFCH